MKQETAGACNKFLGCHFENKWGFDMCSPKNTNALIKKHAIAVHKKDIIKGDEFVQTECNQNAAQAKMTVKSFCEDGTLSIQTCNHNGSMRKSLVCARKTGLLHILAADGKKPGCGKKWVHPMACTPL
jgi:hypothetical protein